MLVVITQNERKGEREEMQRRFQMYLQYFHTSESDEWCYWQSLDNGCLYFLRLKCFIHRINYNRSRVYTQERKVSKMEASKVIVITQPPAL